MPEFNVGDIIIGRADSHLLSDNNLIAQIITIRKEMTSDYVTYVCRVIYTDSEKSKLHADEIFECRHSIKAYKIFEWERDIFSLGRKFDDERRVIDTVRNYIRENLYSAKESKKYKVGDKFMNENEIKDIKFTISIDKAMNCQKTFSKKNIPAISKYLVNGKSVVVFFADGSKESVVCSDGDKFDLEVGIEKCILKKVCGSDAKNQIKKVIKTQEEKEKAFKAFQAKTKELKEKAEARRKKNHEKKMQMRARYEAKYQVMLEEEKKKIKARKILKEDK